MTEHIQLNIDFLEKNEEHLCFNNIEIQKALHDKSARNFIIKNKNKLNQFKLLPKILMNDFNFGLEMCKIFECNLLDLMQYVTNNSIFNNLIFTNLTDEDILNANTNYSTNDYHDTNNWLFLKMSERENIVKKNIKLLNITIKNM